MLRDKVRIQKFEGKLTHQRKPNFYRNLTILQELHKAALQLSVFGRDLRDGFEVDLRVARIMNHVKKTS